MINLSSILSEIKRESNTVALGFSTGKDSLVLLDMLIKNGFEVKPFFMYMVKDISFQKKIIDFVESKYGVEVFLTPHFNLYSFLKFGVYCIPDYKIQVIPKLKLYDLMREKLGCDWLALGERKDDFYGRRCKLKKLKYEVIDEKKKYIYPLSGYREQDIYHYLKINNLPTPEGFGQTTYEIELTPKRLYPIYKNYPEDYKRIKQVFPFIDAIIKEVEIYGNK